MRNRTESFVKQDERRKVGLARLDSGCLQPVAVNPVTAGRHRSASHRDTTAGANESRKGESLNAWISVSMLFSTASPAVLT